MKFFFFFIYCPGSTLRLGFGFFIHNKFQIIIMRWNDHFIFIQFAIQSIKVFEIIRLKLYLSRNWMNKVWPSYNFRSILKRIWALLLFIEMFKLIYNWYDFSYNQFQVWVSFRIVQKGIHRNTFNPHDWMMLILAVVKMSENELKIRTRDGFKLFN